MYLCMYEAQAVSTNTNSKYVQTGTVRIYMHTKSVRFLSVWMKDLEIHKGNYDYKADKSSGAVPEN